MILKHRFNVKPLSANKMFGKSGKITFKTKDYLTYQNDIRDEILEEAEDDAWPFGASQTTFTIIAGLSNRGADLDNVLKPLFDTYQSIYSDFNDNKVYHIEAYKDIVKKGEEYLDVTIKEWKDEIPDNNNK